MIVYFNFYCFFLIDVDTNLRCYLQGFCQQVLVIKNKLAMKCVSNFLLYIYFKGCISVCVFFFFSKVVWRDRNRLISISFLFSIFFLHHIWHKCMLMPYTTYGYQNYSYNCNYKLINSKHELNVINILRLSKLNTEIYV